MFELYVVGSVLRRFSSNLYSSHWAPSWFAHVSFDSFIVCRLSFLGLTLPKRNKNLMQPLTSWKNKNKKVKFCSWRVYGFHATCYVHFEKGGLLWRFLIGTSSWWYCIIGKKLLPRVGCVVSVCVFI
jgi:hypothetical protein